MTLKEFYAIIGGDYDGTLARLITEVRIKKFVFKFKDDPNYNELCSALEKGNVEQAFMSAHTLKGVCQNLGFDSLYRNTYAITEILRGGSLDLDTLMDELTANYLTIINSLSTLEE